MLGTLIKAKFLPQDYDVFAGMDVDKKHMDVTFTDHRHQMKSIKMPHQADHLLAYTHRHFPGQRVAFAYEAGPTGYGLYDRIVQAGHPCLVLAPSMIPSAPGNRVKTNRLDSRKISQVLRSGNLQSIHVPTPVYRQLRHLVQMRDTYVRQAAGFQHRIKALLLLEGLAFPDPSGRWAIDALTKLHDLPCEPVLRFKLDRLLSSWRFAQEQGRQVTAELQRFCRKDPELARNLGFLTSIPGIGRIVGTHLLARIGDWRQLGDPRQLASFLGLVPSEDSTGDGVHRGPITRTGDRRLCAKLNQAAWVAIRQEPELSEFFWRIYHRHPKPVAAQKAVTAVARKLCMRIACILKEQRPYVVRDTSRTMSQEETAMPQGTTRDSGRDKSSLAAL
jgi:transposase